LFRWFVGLSMDDPVWDATVLCKNRDRLLKAIPADVLWPNWPKEQAACQVRRQGK
jgi:hypothetical protein